jgi:ketosteroid isomerase-like protein
MSRTPKEVFQHHVGALGAGDLDGIVEDYAGDAVFITPAGVQRGKDGIRPRSRNCWPTCRTPPGR